MRFQGRVIVVPLGVLFCLAALAGELFRDPVTPAQLQAEINRMLQSSHDPETLEEIFEALNHDPFLIAETLARSELVDTRLREHYAFDPQIHGKLSQRAEGALRVHGAVDDLRKMGGDYREITFTRVSDAEARRASFGSETAQGKVRPTRALNETEWNEVADRLAKRFNVEASDLPVGSVSGVEESLSAFSVTAVLDASDDEMTVASVTWSKTPFDGWWEGRKKSLSDQIDVPTGN